MDLPSACSAYDFCAQLLALTDYDVGPLIEEAAEGECEWLEFKRQSEPPAAGPERGETADDYRWHVARAIIAMANSGGGCILPGVEDDGTPVGLGPCDPKDYLASS